MRRISTVAVLAVLALGAAACGTTIEQKAATGAVAGAVVGRAGRSRGGRRGRRGDGARGAPELTHYKEGLSPSGPPNLAF